MSNKNPLVSIQNISVTFDSRGEKIQALRNVSLDIDFGQSVGIVGPSGSGKSTLARCLMRLRLPDEGQILFNDKVISNLSQAELRLLRPQMQMIFQDPGGSLNPYMKVGSIIGEPLLVHAGLKGERLRSEVFALIEKVGLQKSDINKYPHEFSGGQKQRIAIARAVALSPLFLLCDEPTSALDVSIQATVLNLLCDLREEYGLTTLFISHDLAVVSHFCTQVVVMSEGKIVERGNANSVIQKPTHEITKKLIENC